MRSAVVVLWMLSACSDSFVSSQKNRDPQVAILSPAGGAVLFDGYRLRLEGSVTDADDREEDLIVRWQVGGVDLCTGGVDDSDGLARCDGQVPAPAEALDIALFATDPDGATGVDRVTVRVAPSQPPTATLLSPLADDRLYVDRAVSFEALVDDQEDPSQLLVVRWTSSKDGELSSLGTTPDSSGTSSGSARLTEGEHEIVVEVTDLTGKTGVDRQVVTVRSPNAVPTCAWLTPVDGQVSPVDAEVRLQAFVADADDAVDGLDVRFASDVDGVLGTLNPTSAGDAVITVPSLTVGPHVLTVTVTDPAGDTCSDVVVLVVGTPPVVRIDAPAVGDVVRLGDPVRLRVTVSDAEDAADLLDVRWTSDLDGVVSEADPDSSGVAEVVLGTLSAGLHALTARVEDTSGLYAERVRALRVNRPPSGPVVEIQPATASSEDTLVAVITQASVDADGDPVTYAFTWSINGAVQPALSGSSVPASATTKGEVWTVRVTPADDVHQGPYAEATRFIGNAAPQITEVAIAPRALRVGDTATCTVAGSDPDGDVLQRRFTWEDEQGVSLGSGSTLLVPPLGAGGAVTCRATLDDGAGGLDVGSDTVVLGNRDPVIDAVVVTPNPAVPQSLLTCSVTARDPDGDVPALTYTWTNDGVVLGSGPTLQLTPQRAEPGDTVQCLARATDPVGAFVEGSDSVPVEDPRPSIAAIQLTVVGGGPARARSTLRCTYTGYADPQGDPDRTTLQWTVDGAPEASTATLSNAFVRGQTVTCTVTPFDGVNAGTPLQASLVIEDTPPSITGVSITPGRPRAGQQLVCSYGGFDDVDGDADASTFAWSVDGVDQGRTLATFPGTAAAGSVVSCTVTPRADGVSGVARSASVVINTPPTAPGVRVTPDPSGTLNDLVCAVSTPATDGDGDALTYTHTWLRDGVPTSYGASGLSAQAVSVVPGTATTNGEVWTCEVRADDGVELGPAGAADTLITCAPGSGQDAACAATTCKEILFAGLSYGSGPYWIELAGGGTVEVWCDMERDGGGWTLVLQAGRFSDYAYDHPVWTSSAGGGRNLWDVSDDTLDAVSPTFYLLEGTETRLCLETWDRTDEACATVNHVADTARNLANGPEIPSFRGQAGLFPLALLAVVPDWSELGFQRWGWNHGFTDCGGLRIGFSGDGDLSDSRDSAIGIGFYLENINCNPVKYEGVDYASGYYHFPWPLQPDPGAAPAPATLWLR